VKRNPPFGKYSHLFDREEKLAKRLRKRNPLAEDF